MKTFVVTGIIFSIFSLSGCTSLNNLNKGQMGAVGGAAGGAVIGQAIGRNTQSTLIGTAIGTVVGYMVGNEMDKYDRQQMSYIFDRASSGQSYSWVNPDNGNNYQMSPQPAFNNANNQVCREAEITAVINGRVQKTYSTACRNERGQWILTG